MTTFSNEPNIPRLSVPSTESTITQLLSALKPLVSTEEYDEIVAEAHSFKQHKIINLIQKHLEALRGDILPRNPYLILKQDPYSKTLNPPTQAQRAANLINSSLKVVVSLRNETLKPDVTPKNGNPLSMNCYRNLFEITRAPDIHDNAHHIILKKYKNINDSRHILVICNNQYYKLEVLTEYTEEAYEKSKTKHRIWFGDHDLSLILQDIIDESSEFSTLDSVNNSIGSLTTQTYHVWKQGRLELEKSNAKFLETIDNALFVVVLDVLNSPESVQDKTKVISYGTSELQPGTSIQCGSCTSRWYDKLQVIVTKNFVAGVLWESTSMDSTAILRFISDIYTDSILKLARNINGSDIHLSETRLADLINQHDYITMDLKLDIHFISKSGYSVDSFLQVVLQIANYTLYGRIANTLEPITTRFRDARTELIPVQDEEISRLGKLFISNSTPSEKLRAFRRAVSSHNERYRNAMIGKGFERHLAVDYLNEVNKDVAGLEPIPELAMIPHLHIPSLTNPSIEKIFSPELSVSNCGKAALRFFGIPPAHNQGFGIGYIIHRDKVCITASSKHRQTNRLLDTFKSVVNEIKRSIRQDSNFLLQVADSEPRKSELLSFKS
ncbi:Carnitine O-acetyltransferase YAT2 [Meyerozyma sp. JA9]|nr:Carnitine O-acetyltransferase YAT2 [Meyerozyma sp. JA9]